MLKYKISMSKPNTHYFEVEMEISGFRNDSPGPYLNLVMPVWTPGSYLIREFGRNVLDFQASDLKNGRHLDSRKTAKNKWLIELLESDAVLVKYRIYAFELTVDTSYLDDFHGIVNGASVFMYPEGLESKPSTLTVHPFDGWDAISTSLEKIDVRDNGGGISFRVPNFDILVDSPIEIGNQSIHNFVVKDVEHSVSIYSRKKFDETKLVSDIKKIVESTIPVFGEIPYKKYLFLVDMSAGESFGGLEHLASTHCIAPYFRLDPIQEYKQLLTLFSHELFHAWNVKRMRPEGLGPFNYTAETYTKSLWIAEGITSYYDDLIVRRAGIFSVGEYLDALIQNIALLSSLPGSKWESAEESSFDTWIRHYRINENTPNVHSSYYVQGAVIGWMIDMAIRRSTSNAKNLDAVMKKIYQETYANEDRGFREEEFEKACNEISGESVSSAIFDTRVRGKDPVDYQKYLGYAGLVAKAKPEKETNKGFLGVRIRSDSGRTIVSTVLFDSPAEACGVSAGDEIVAIDGLRMDNSRLAFYLENSNPQTTVSVLLSRDGALHQVEAKVGQRPNFEYRIFKRDSCTREEEALFKSWLGASWEDEIKYEEYRQSPAKKPQFDYL